MPPIVRLLTHLMQIVHLQVTGVLQRIGVLQRTGHPQVLQHHNPTNLQEQVLQTDQLRPVPQTDHLDQEGLIILEEIAHTEADQPEVIQVLLVEVVAAEGSHLLKAK